MTSDCSIEAVIVHVFQLMRLMYKKYVDVNIPGKIQPKATINLILFSVIHDS